MGEFSASDCSWKKMVIAKANDQWISKIKTERGEIADTRDVTIVTVEFSNIKQEKEDESAEPICQNVEDASSAADSHDDAIHDDGDPLSIEEEPSKRRRRKTSGLKNETPEERSARLAKMSAYAAQRLANETPEQRATRLKRMSEYAAKRLAQETSEQRAKRLARMSAYAARRLAKETPEQRQARLARMSAYAARRHALKKISSPSTSEIPDTMAYYNHITNNIMPDQS